MRDSLIDVAKGIGILLVVFAHIFEGIVTDIIYLFHMPLFFYLSGSTFSLTNNKYGIKYGIVKRMKSLLIPYFIFSVLSFFYWWKIESIFRPIHDSPIFDGKIGELSMPLQQFINIFVSKASGSAFIYNSPLWFLTCLFVSIVCYTVIKKYSGKFSFLFCCMCSALFYVLLRDAHLPWCFEIALPALPLLWIGDASYKRIKTSTTLEALFIAIVSLIICITIVSVFHPVINMMEHYFGAWWQFYLCSVSLIALLLLFGRFVLRFESGVLQWLGKNSLIIMCVHGPIYRIVLYAVSVIINKDISAIRHSLLMSSCIVLLVIMIIIPIAVIINRYLPWVLGRKMKSKISNTPYV
jgi:fucose 4-O-acetylase-like acetyltransferase